MKINRNLLAILLLSSATALCMEESIYDARDVSYDREQKYQAEVIAWLLQRIKPLNGGRFFDENKPGAKANCVPIAEACVKVLSGEQEPALVPAVSRNLEMTTWTDKATDKIGDYQEGRPEQVALNKQQDFLETIQLLEDGMNVQVELRDNPIVREGLKYITSSRATIVDDIKQLTGTASSQGQDLRLQGLLYLPYAGNIGGHLMNFYRDQNGTVYFVDAQSEEISTTLPTKILQYTLTDQVFFYPYYGSKERAYIKQEQIALNPIKQEQESVPMQQDSDEIGLGQEPRMSAKAEVKQYACPVARCGDIFSSMNSLVSHKKITHQLCAKCPEIKDLPRSKKRICRGCALPLAKDYFVVESSNFYTCPFAPACSFYIAKEDHYSAPFIKDHLQYKHYICSLCQAPCGTHENFYQHVKEQHQNAQQQANVPQTINPQPTDRGSLSFILNSQTSENAAKKPRIEADTASLQTDQGKSSKKRRQRPWKYTIPNTTTPPQWLSQTVPNSSTATHVCVGCGLAFTTRQALNFHIEMNHRK